MRNVGLQSQALPSCALLLSVVMGAAIVQVTTAAEPIWVTKIVREIPKNEAAMAVAHQQSKDASVQVSAGESLLLPEFAGQYEYRVTVDGKRTVQPVAYSRLGVLNFGMTLTPEDKAELPIISKRRILSRVQGNYISVQLRVQRDSTGGEAYLYHKPFAAVGAYGNEQQAQQFAALMEDTVREIRSIGLYVPSGQSINAETLRTLVGINKTKIVVENQSGGTPALQDHYEFLFVRLRMDGERPVLHTFGTTEYRQQLNYFVPYTAPRNPDECTIKSTIVFTAYTAAKQSPSAKAVRKVDLRPQVSLTMETANAFVNEQGFEGDALDNLTATLDAVIDGQLR